MAKLRVIRSSFRGPNDTEWKRLKAVADDGDDGEAVAKRNREQLHDVLLKSLQMQNLVVLAGSGCSISAGGPTMWDLWINAVGGEPCDEARTAAETIDYDLDEEDNQNIELFLSRIEAFLQLYEDEYLETFLDAAKAVILKDCSEFIDADELEPHRVFVRRLSRRRARDTRLKVFTTNYDLCFEKATSDLGGVVLDGFSFTAPRRYDPRYFSYDIVRRPHSGDKPASYLEGVFQLYKLHGSVNWSRDEHGNIIEHSDPDPSSACLIYPARGKYQQSYTQPHLESISQYLAAVREPNTCVLVAGFGFNDDHLSEPLLAAARSNPHLRLIIADRSPEKKIADGTKYWTELAELAASGEDVWIVQSKFDRFVEMIPDLQSLTPADALMKAVKKAAGGS